MQTKLLQLKALGSILRHFKNPLLIILLRLGMVRLPYFLYRISKRGRQYKMLARPTTTSMADLFVLREVLVDETYQDLLPLFKKKNIRLVDVGSNIGSFTVWIHRTLGVREAFCFEPEPDSFRLLQFNLSQNGCTFAKAFNHAVGGAERTISIALKQDSPGGTNIYTDQNRSAPNGAPEVQVISFENWLCQQDSDFDLIKMDCEGAEWEIITKTDPRQLARFKVCIFEVHDDPEKKHSVSDFKKLMESLGFKTLRWDNISQGLYLGVRE